MPNTSTDELGAFVKDMHPWDAAPKPAVEQEEAHDRASDWAQLVTDGQDPGDEEYDDAYRDAIGRIKQQFHIVSGD